ncbi:MAG: hypothetical protein CMK89_17335 [Pseudomonadales bacterium]|nr:hypothetical protein [Pseudomonadales bacterium]
MVVLTRYLISGLFAGMLLGLGGCSSDSYLAQSSTSTFDNLSPVGSRQVTREQQLVLASHYNIQIAYAADGRSTEFIKDLNLSARDSLARHMKRYFSHVRVDEEAQSLAQALQHAKTQRAQLLMYPRVENWPNIEPIRVQECKDKDGNKKTSVGQCEPTKESDSDELVVNVGIYDVLSGMHLDSIHARSRRGMASYLFENSDQELDELSRMIVMRLTSNSNGY